MKQLEIAIPAEADASRIDSLESVSGYRCIYADPPWAYSDKTCAGGVGAQYDTMGIEAICSLPGIQSVPHKDGCHLWLWTTWPMLREGKPHRVLDAWGFRWVGEIVWLKPGLGVGRWLRPSTEILILGIRGKLRLLRYNQHGHFRPRGDIEAPRQRHSQKPKDFYEIIETLSPGPRIELFARRPRAGWHRWGNQA